MKPMKSGLAAVLLAAATPAVAVEPGDVISGEAYAQTGNRLTVGRTEVYLAGIKAPVPGQKCQAGSLPWYCGKKAKETLRKLIAGQTVTCEIRFTPDSATNPDRDVGDGSLPTEYPGAECRTPSHNLNGTMIRRGLAVPRSGSEGRRYRPIAERAKANNRGVWQGQ